MTTVNVKLAAFHNAADVVLTADNAADVNTQVLALTVAVVDAAATYATAATAVAAKPVKANRKALEKAYANLQRARRAIGKVRKAVHGSKDVLAAMPAMDAQGLLLSLAKAKAVSIGQKPETLPPLLLRREAEVATFVVDVDAVNDGMAELTVLAQGLSMAGNVTKDDSYHEESTQIRTMRMINERAIAYDLLMAAEDDSTKDCARAVLLHLKGMEKACQKLANGSDGELLYPLVEELANMQVAPTDAAMAVVWEQVSRLVKRTRLVETRQKGLKASCGREVVVTTAKGGTSRIALPRLIKLLKMNEQLLMVKTGNTELSFWANKSTREVKGYPVIGQVLALHRAGIDLDGLKSNPALRVVVEMDGSGKAVVNKTPFKPGTAMAGFLAEQGYMADLNAETFGKHGYVIASKDVCVTPSLFAKRSPCGTGILVHQALSKAIVRVSKQIKDASDGFYDTANFVVVTMDTSALHSNDPATLEARVALERSFGAGAMGANPEAFAKFGVHRQVGSQVLGQKAVVGNLDHVVHPDIVTAIGAMDGATIVTGLNSLKCPAAISRLNWEDATLANGATILVARVPNVDMCVTESAACSRYELVPMELKGLEAQRHFVNKVLKGQTNGGVFDKAFELVKEGKDLAEALQQLESEEVIRLKLAGAKTNIQLFQSIATAHGLEATRNIMEAVVVGPRAAHHVADINLVDDLMSGKLDQNLIVEVDFAEILAAFQDAVGATKSGGKEFSKSVHTGIVLAVLQNMIDEGKEWARIAIPGLDPVMFPTGGKLSAAVEMSDNATYSMVTGLTAELIETLWYYADDSAPSEASLAVTRSKLVAARDKMVGKELARLRAFGTSSLIVSGWRMAGTMVMSHTLNVQMQEARWAYGEECAALWGKSPTVLAQAVKRVQLTTTKGWSEEEITLSGNAIYAAVQLVVEAEDDADGDMVGNMIVPLSALRGTSLASVDYLSPSEPEHNPTAPATKQFYTGERAGLFLNIANPKAFPEVFYTWDECTKAVLAAVESRSLVGKYTMAQMVAQDANGAIVSRLEQLLLEGNFVARSVIDRFCVGITARKNFKTAQVSVHRAHDLATVIARAATLLQGRSLQHDSMDRIKREDGKVLHALSALLSPTVVARKRDRFSKEEIISTFRNEQQEAAIYGKTDEQIITAYNKGAAGDRANLVCKIIAVLGDYGVNLRDYAILDELGADELTVRMNFVSLIVDAYCGVGAALDLDKTGSTIQRDVCADMFRESSVKDLETHGSTEGKVYVERENVQSLLVQLARQYRHVV